MFEEISGNLSQICAIRSKSTLKDVSIWGSWVKREWELSVVPFTPFL
jgi:hypothetical protein